MVGVTPSDAANVTSPENQALSQTSSVDAGNSSSGLKIKSQLSRDKADDENPSKVAYSDAKEDSHSRKKSQDKEKTSGSDNEDGKNGKPSPFSPNSMS